MKNKPFLICFTGIDGCGKTSQAMKLGDYLDSTGIKSKYIWNKYDPVFIKPFMIIGRKLFMNGADMASNYAGYRKAKKKVLGKKLIAAPFLLLFLLEYLLHALVKVKLPAMLGNNIICDRYTYDVIVSVANDFEYSQAFISRVLKIYWLILPRPDLTILLDLPAKIAFGRKDDTISLPHLKKQRLAYRKLAADAGAIILDSQRDFQELENIIRENAKAIVRETPEKD